MGWGPDGHVTKGKGGAARGRQPQKKTRAAVAELQPRYCYCRQVWVWIRAVGHWQPQLLEQHKRLLVWAVASPARAQAAVTACCC